ncbi:cation diffusion facilitator family transporter [Ruminiclostridium cellobioparum]|uniref:Cation diffusion facilitator family transporter n=1 Tax=Ruminiclostridium cellobioparum subsp. termitidis CT1112 TaxID=1195236 RepID=S0FKT9_RUMCE|nr:cation diffusion facilitator family transporter [Ruminiclostridium cellobioparum]EMS70921.1 cation diffusion facilitator family transporter [Ruminiclostridium cellobioparum subsp. termitidis CT1112]
MDRFKTTKKVAVLGIAANIFLLSIKLAAGFLSRSQAMIADGFNSAGDVFASVMTLVGNSIASRPEDSDHPYGHGKAEYIFSMIISLSLMFISITIFRSALSSIINKAAFETSWFLITVAIVTIAVKLSLFLYTNRVGKVLDNLLVLANSEDHRNDVFVTTGTLLGILMGYFGFNWVDGAVGIGISLWIFYTGIKIFISSFKVLMDTDIDPAFKANTYALVKGISGVDHIDSINAKPVGAGYILLIKVSVDGEMSVNESHKIASEIKFRVKDIKGVKDAVVHINPC